MGFIRDYKVFFNVKVVDYTTDSPLAMFSFLPRSNCQQLLVDHQLIFRNLDTGFSVYFAENPIARDPVSDLPCDSRTHRCSPVIRLFLRN